MNLVNHNLNGLQISLMTNETRKAFGLPTISRPDRRS